MRSHRECCAKCDRVSRSLLNPIIHVRVGDLRLQLPKAVTSYKGTLNATTFGNQCIQQSLALPDLPDNVPPAIPATLSALVSVEVQGPTQSEDCMYNLTDNADVI